MNSIKSSSRRAARAQFYLGASTALPLLLAASPALGQAIVETSNSDIVVEEDSATGTPVAVELATDGGSITVSVETVVAQTTAGVRDHIVGLETAAGAIDGQFGSITATGDGYVMAVEAYSDSGDINVHVGEIVLDGAATSGIQAYSVSGDVTVQGDNVLLLGEGGDPDNQFYPEGLLAWSEFGAATVLGGTVETRGLFGSAAYATAGTDATVVLDTAIAHSDGAVTVYAGGVNSATIDVGTASMLGDGNAIEGFSDGGVTITAGNVDSLGGGIYGEGGSVEIAAGTVDAVDFGLSGYSPTGGPVSLSVEDVTTSGGFSIAVRAETTGDVTIDAGSVTVTGPGAFPGIGPDGLRYDQGGIVVYGGDGSVSVNAGTVDIAGEHRYGISVRGNGAISIDADDVTLASADAVAVVARGGAGDVSITTGTVITTGPSGVGVYADSTTGNILLNAGVTRVESEGIEGPFTGDAVVATSDSGTIAIASADAFSAGYAGSAIYAQSGGNVSIDSGMAGTTGDDGVAVWGISFGGNVSIESDNVTATGADTFAIQAQAANGLASARIGDMTALGANAFGAYVYGRDAAVVVDGSVETERSSIVAVSTTGTTDVLVDGTVMALNGAGVVSQSQQGLVEVAEGASVTGRPVGVALLTNSGGFTQFYNSGTVSATEGAAVAGNPITANTAAGDFYIQNNGTLIGGNGFAVVTGAGQDVLELTELSIIDGVADLGAGDDRLVLDFNDDAPAGAVGQVAATVHVEGLSVDSGNWHASADQSQYAFVEVEEDASLTISQSADGEASIEAPLFELDGTLLVNFNAEDTDEDFFTSQIVGAGSVHLIGSTTLIMNDTTGLDYTGGTFVENGELLLTTLYGGDITTSGDGVFELGEGGDFTGDLVNDGTFVFSRLDDYSFLGDFTGSGQLEKYGAGTLTFAGLYGFEGTTSVFGGAVAFTGQLAEDTELEITEGTVDLSQVEGGEQTIAELSGEGGTLVLGETQLMIQQFGDTVFSGEILGLGTIIKDGDGDLKLNGDGTSFTGTGQVDGGTLSVNGDFSNADFEVNEGGTLGGAGFIGDTSVNGGTLAPGNSIDTLTVIGNVTFTEDSIFEVEVNAAGESDLLQATGTATLGDAAVEVLAESGTYRPLTNYTILTADGGISGTFGSVDINLAFLDPLLVYSDTAVTLQLTRNDLDFASFGETANQAFIGRLVESLGFGNTLYDETLTLIDEDVAVSFASLTGEVYPSYGSAVIETAEMLRRQTSGSMRAEGAFAWATGLYNDIDSGNAAGDVGLSGKGVAGGLGIGRNGFSASAGVGMLDQNQDGDLRDGDVTFAIGQLAYGGETGIRVSAGAQFGWVDAAVQRQTALGSIGGTVSGNVDGDYNQLFAELAYHLPLGAVAVEPFAGVRRVSLNLDGLTEAGAPTALTVSALEQDVTFADLGVRLSGEFGAGIRPYASAAYRRAWGERSTVATVGFVGTAGTALIGGLPIAKNAAELSAGLAVTRGAMDFEVGYDGTFSKAFDSHGVKAVVGFRF